PKNFDIIVDPQEGYELHGEFGPWQLAQGGSGGIVILSTEISKGVMKASGKDYSLDSTVAYVAVKLLYVPQKPVSSSAKPGSPVEVTDLMVNSAGRSPADPAAIVQDLIFPGLKPPIAIVALMVGGLQEWFNQNLVQFAYVFSTVSLNQVVA